MRSPGKRQGNCRTPDPSLGSRFWSAAIPLPLRLSGLACSPFESHLRPARQEGNPLANAEQQRNNSLRAGAEPFPRSRPIHDSGDGIPMSEAAAPSPLRQQGMDALRGGLYDTAIEAFSRHLMTAPTDVEAQAWL